MKAWQVMAAEMDNGLTGTHILFPERRYPDSAWELAIYSVRAEMDRLTKALLKSRGREKQKKHQRQGRLKKRRKDRMYSRIMNRMDIDCMQVMIEDEGRHSAQIKMVIERVKEAADIWIRLFHSCIGLAVKSLYSYR